MEQAKALAILKSGKNVFLTGSAGAGKTYVLNQYINYLKERKVPVAVTASTGIAATHMNGMTIHAWAGIGVKDELTSRDLKFMKEKKYLEEKLKLVQVLIIDEISMLHKRQLDMVNQVLQFFKENTLAFGGVQVVFSGDFFQLPPVGSQGEESRDKFAFMSKAWLDAGLCICYITEQHRQSDNDLHKILNQIRNGEAGEDTTVKLQQAIDKVGNHSIIPTKLYTHNIDVDKVNVDHLRKLDTESKKFVAISKGNEKLREMLSKTVLTDEELELKPGARVMFIRNNYEKGYMNGTLGEVLEFNEDGHPVVMTASGKLIDAETEVWSIQDEKGKTLASFEQVPLRLAWAITVHKSQGMTLDAAEIDLGKTFERGQGYVALSRLKDIDNLKLAGFNRMALEVDPLALKADKRFRELSAESDAKWSIAELEKRFDLFVKSCGGITDIKTIDKNRKKLGFKKDPKKNTFELTYDLIRKGKSIPQMAEERAVEETTIVSHLIKIKELHPELDLSQYKPSARQIQKVSKAIEDLRENNKNGKVTTGAIYHQLEEKVSYLDIKLSLMFLGDVMQSA